MPILHYYFYDKLGYFFSFLLLFSLLVEPKTVNAKELVSFAFAAQKTNVDLGNIGAYYWQKGDLHQAIEAWKQEAQNYQTQELPEKEAQALLKVAQAYSSLGQFTLAIFELEKVFSLAKEPALLARAWEQWGNIHARSGFFEKANSAYLKSLELKQSLSTLNNLVVLLQKQVQTALLNANSSRKGQDTERYQALAENHRASAAKYIRQALNLARKETSSSTVRTSIEASKLSIRLSPKEIERGSNILAELPASRTKIFLAINWAKLDSKRANYWLLQGERTAKTTGDVYAACYVTLERGLLAEKLEDISQALEYAQSAQLKAQSQSAYDCLYQAYWLAGRMYQKKVQTGKAIAAYQQAITALDAVSQGSINIDIERRIDFKNSIEPLYRQLLTLLLEESKVNKSTLEEALFIKDKLQLAQLQNYFGDNCFSIQNEIEKNQNVLMAKDAVLLNSIVLNNQTHFILKLPDGRLFHHRASYAEAEITDLATRWYFNLQQRHTRRFLTQSQIFYDLMIRPFHFVLKEVNPSTIVFVHDGVLRNLPMAALHDGNKFLPQKWASVSSLGLNIEQTQQNLSQAAVFGMGEPRNGWSALNNVDEEVEEVVELVGGETFLNRDFTMESFAKELKQEDFSVVHVASHAYFGGIRENSFILTYDRPIFASDLENFLLQSKGEIELLVLSACETSLSSDRSVLGLAGVALRSGVESVLGSFWLVRDEEQVELMQAFYFNLKEQNLDKAQALQQLQVAQIELNQHPSSWAALNLIGHL